MFWEQQFQGINRDEGWPGLIAIFAHNFHKATPPRALSQRCLYDIHAGISRQVRSVGSAQVDGEILRNRRGLPRNSTMASERSSERQMPEIYLASLSARFPSGNFDAGTSRLTGRERRVRGGVEMPSLFVISMTMRTMKKKKCSAGETLVSRNTGLSFETVHFLPFRKGREATETFPFARIRRGGWKYGFSFTVSRISFAKARSSNADSRTILSLTYYFFFSVSSGFCANEIWMWNSFAMTFDAKNRHATRNKSSVRLNNFWWNVNDSEMPIEVIRGFSLNYRDVSR